jgi:ribosomal protein S18 acetylase RimI-like enzyme
MRIARLTAGDAEIVMAATDLFDRPPTPDWTEKFLATDDHHLLFAFDGDTPIGFVSAVETTHPDKGTEMFLYELDVHADRRREGVGAALVSALAELARERGCYGMWVLTDADNEAALATYRRAGAGAAEESLMLTWEFAPTGEGSARTTPSPRAAPRPGTEA